VKLKKIKIFAATSALMLSNPAIASTSYNTTPVPEASQAVFWENGTALIESSQTQSKLSFKFLHHDAGKLFFLGTYKNGTDAPLDFGIDQISVNGADGVTLKVYTRDELIRSIKQKRDTKKFFAILGGTVGVLATLSAAQQTRTGYDRNGRSYTERYTDDGILAVGTALSVGAGAGVLLGANKNSKAKISYLNENYLSRQTVPAGGEGLGVIAVQIPKLKGGKGSIGITVNAFGDVHNLKFNVEKN